MLLHRRLVHFKTRQTFSFQLTVAPHVVPGSQHDHLFDMSDGRSNEAVDIQCPGNQKIRKALISDCRYGRIQKQVTTDPVLDPQWKEDQPQTNGRCIRQNIRSPNRVRIRSDSEPVHDPPSLYHLNRRLGQTETLTDNELPIAGKHDTHDQQRQAQHLQDDVDDDRE